MRLKSRWVAPFFALTLLSGFAADETVRLNGHPVHADRVLVKFHSESPVRKAGKARFQERSIVRVLGLPRGTVMKRNPFQRRSARKAKRRPDILTGHDLSAPFVEIDLNGKIPVRTALRILKRHPWVAAAEPDPWGEGGATIPNRN